MSIRRYMTRAVFACLIVRLFSCCALRADIPAPPAGFDPSQYDLTLTLLAPVAMIAFGILFVLRGVHRLRRTKRREFERNNWSPMLRKERR